MKRAIETQQEVEAMLNELKPQVDTATFNRVRDQLVRMVLVSVLPPSCSTTIKNSAQDKDAERETFGEFSFNKERFIAP